MPSIINTLWEVLDEADALSYADLFLLRQLGGQTGLTRCGMVHGHVSLLLVTDKKQQHINIKQKPVILLNQLTLSIESGLNGQALHGDKLKNKEAV